MLKNENLNAKIGVDPAQNEPSKVGVMDRPFPKWRLSVTAQARFNVAEVQGCLSSEV